MYVSECIKLCYLITNAKWRTHYESAITIARKYVHIPFGFADFKLNLFSKKLPAPAKQNADLYYPQTNMKNQTKNPCLHPIKMKRT